MNTIDMSFDTVPTEESSYGPLEDIYYRTAARLEVKYLAEQIKQEHPELEVLNFRRKANPHDFGTYFTMEVEGDTALVMALEGELFPMHWNKEILEKLKAEFKETTGIEYTTERE